MSTIQDPRKTWLAAGSLLSLVEDASLWGPDCSSPLPSSSGCCPPGSLPLVEGRGLYAASQLSFGVCSILCSVSRPGWALEPFMGKFSFFSLSLAIPQFGLLSHVSSLRLSSGHSGLVLTLSTDYAAHASLSSTCLLVEDPSVWGTSLLAAIRHVFCVVVVVFFFSSPGCVALWDSKTPQRPACERLSYCLETFFLHDSLPRAGLCP